MTKGLKYWSEPQRYCDQNNNSVEKIKRSTVADIVTELKIKLPSQYHTTLEWYNKYYWKESCSAESIYTCLDCMGHLTYQDVTWNNLKVQPSDFMVMHINDPKYDKEYQGGLKMDNRYIYSWQKVLIKMGYKTAIKKAPSPAFISEHVSTNHGVMINIPGHYCAAIAWDYDTDEMIYHNPNPADGRNKNKGRWERLKAEDFDTMPVKYALAFWN